MAALKQNIIQRPLKAITHSVSTQTTDDIYSPSSPQPLAVPMIHRPSPRRRPRPSPVSRHPMPRHPAPQPRRRDRLSHGGGPAEPDTTLGSLSRVLVKEPEDNVTFDKTIDKADDKGNELRKRQEKVLSMRLKQLGPAVVLLGLGRHHVNSRLESFHDDKNEPASNIAKNHDVLKEKQSKIIKF